MFSGILAGSWTESAASFVTWPIVILVLGIIAIVVFRDEFRSLIARTERIRAPGIGFEAGVDQTKPDALAKDAAPDAAEELHSMLDNQLVVEQSSLITTDLERRKVSPGEREKFLVRLTAAISLAWQFETIYHAIWGSQIELLQALNPIAPRGLPATHIKHFFEGGAKRFPLMYKNYSSDQWLQFLISNALVVADGAAAFVITTKGREFLKYLIERGYGTQKAG